MEWKQTHEPDALARLLEQYRGKSNIEGLVSALASEVQVLEDGIWGLHTQTRLDVSTGAQLDQIGRIVGQAREGRDDDSFRTWIAARIRLNNSSGTAGEIVDVFVPLVGPGTIVSVEEHFPASFVLRLDGGVVSEALQSQLLRFMHLARAAGVYSLLIWQQQPDAEVFTFESGPGLGFGDAADAAVGGALIGARS